ncbi:MAG TPA: STAS domain-containing protein [Rhodocyclaceae bacterium]
MAGEIGSMAIEGELSIYAAAGLRERLLEALDATGTLELDLAAVTEMDSAGVQLLLAAAKQAAQQGKTLRLARCSAAVMDALALCGLGEMAEGQQP